MAPPHTSPPASPRLPPCTLGALAHTTQHGQHTAAIGSHKAPTAALTAGPCPRRGTFTSPRAAIAIVPIVRSLGHATTPRPSRSTIDHQTSALNSRPTARLKPQPQPQPSGLRHITAELSLYFSLSPQGVGIR